MELLETASRFDECEEIVSSDDCDDLVPSDDSEVLVLRVEGEDLVPCSQYVFLVFFLRVFLI